MHPIGIDKRPIHRRGNEMSSSTFFCSLAAAMQSSFIPIISFKIPRPTVKSNPTLLAFESELASRLEQLKSTDQIGYLSIEWLCKATDMVLSTYSSAEMMFPDLHVAGFRGNQKWIDSFWDNSIKLLDICIALKAALSEAKSYCVHLKVALRAAEKDPLCEIQVKRCMNALKKCVKALSNKDDSGSPLAQHKSKIEYCTSMLRRKGERLNMADASNGNFFMAIYAAQVVTIFVCSLLSIALSFKSTRSLSSMCVHGQSTWSSSLATLQQRVEEQIERRESRGSNALLEELGLADIAVPNFHSIMERSLGDKSSCDKEAQILKVKQSAKVLQALLTDLQQRIPSLESHVDSIYRNLLRSRMSFLDMDQLGL
ncbi:hypothetical protein KP509_22G030000 [Ceratopteris richardii]|uniref:Uncharacterized protein n=1 Tax=Ceratopteris richardii TaxID=49495 RepID=A0A8T2S6D3_CERRI|nr:hypothetical protein KP509_22G030000 [Ceratopteris richardii]